MNQPAARAVALIMDGNARWARERGVPVLEGHREGAQALKRTVKNAARIGLAELTAYAFSTENWSRPNAEVQGLMAMFAELIESETPELDDEGVRMRFIGRRERITADLLERMAWAEEVTARNERLRLFVAFNYGGRAEILDAAARFQGGGEEEFRACLYAPEMGDPDVVIRTSGEHRLSNFLLWQSAYSELVFCDALWPDFQLEHLQEALQEFEARQRRFGAR
jgi:undecaprenyl diphosphate synthase